MWRGILVCVGLIGCGGRLEKTDGEQALVVEPEYGGPLAIDCRVDEECPVTLGYQTCGPDAVDGGHCSFRCGSEEQRTACLEWGGQCVAFGVGGEWCQR